MSAFDYDLFVIGAGSGGVRAARIAAGYGARVGIAEKNAFGGTCVNVGCVPKKLMTYAASYAAHIQDAAGYGWSIGESRMDWAIFIDNKNKEIERLNGIYENILAKAGVRIHKGMAQITGPQSVRVENEHITAERILIATGGKPHIPEDIAGASEYGITSDDVFYLKNRPEKILIIGAGYIALEFAGIFRALGSEAHIAYRRDTILNEGFDEDIRIFLEKEMAKKGIILHPNTKISAIKKDNIGYSIESNDLKEKGFNAIIFAAGRVPNIVGLGLDKNGIKLDKNGLISVNRDGQTNIPSIYAVGDVANQIALTPVALAEGHALVDRLYGNKDRYVSYDKIPSAVFSDPPISQVGLTEAQARQQHGDDIDIYKTDFCPMQMVLPQRDERTLMKLVVHRRTDKVLGLHMVGQNAPEIVQGFATALIAGATKADFDRTIGIHPTAAEEFVTMRTLHK